MPTFTLQPYSIQAHYQTFATDGGHLLSRWRHRWSSTSEHRLQLYYNRSRRADPFVPQQENTLDVDFQHFFNPTEAQTFTWGGGYRRIDTRTTLGLRGTSSPTHRSQNLFNGFFQNEWRLLDEQLVLTLGSKFEHTTFTGWEIQPSAKWLWHLNAAQTLWGAVSRAVRIPTILARDGTGTLRVDQLSTNTLPIASRLLPNGHYDSESLLSYELGYRFLPDSAFSLDIAAFYHVYRRLSALDANAPVIRSSPAPHIELQELYSNRSKGESYGLELSGRWSPYEFLRLQLAYTWTRLDLRLIDNAEQAIASISLVDESQTPEQQLSLRTSIDLPYGTELDVWLRYTDRIQQTITQSAVKGRLDLDMRLGWQISDALEVSLVGQGLLDNHWHEYPLEFFLGNYLSEQERRVYVKLDWRF